MAIGSPQYPHTSQTSIRRLKVNAFGRFSLDDCGTSSEPTVRLRKDEVRVGCTTISREALEKLYSLINEKFPKCDRADEV
jgi:hypothetical protein